MGADNRRVGRYSMSEDEILACARDAAAWGWGTVVMQSGEDYASAAGPAAASGS